METMILTGWGWKDYACAAALALRHWKTADILGMSKRRLPEFLNEVKQYKRIMILGVGLDGNPELLGKALKKLKKNSVQVTWFSCFPAPESISEETLSNMDIVLDEGKELVMEVVGDYYKLPYEELLPLAGNKSDKKVLPYRQFIEAAMYAYRNYQDAKSYGEVIRHIAKSDPESCWSNPERKLIEHYKRYGNRELVGKSQVMQDLIHKISLIAPREHARVLIYGESGTGKETVAQQIHNRSPRSTEAFIAFNCASVAPNLLEDRFFGHEKGAFTGANEMKYGLFEQANGGTLFLDEIGELPLDAQAILLRVLEGGRFTRLGGSKEIETDVRLLTATHRDLAAMVKDCKFREDLFYRLNVIQLRVPALREHKSDIGPIADGYWLKQYNHRLEPEQIEALKTYDYPGNVRELFNLLERASVLDEQDFTRLLAEHKQMTASLSQKAAAEVPDELEAAIRLHVKHVYEKYNNNLSKTAEALKAARNTVRKYLEAWP